MKHIYRSIPGWFSFADVYDDAIARAREGSAFVEVGAWKGRSAAYMAVAIANSGKRIDFFVVDHWLGSDEQAHRADRDVRNGTLYNAFVANTAPVAHLLKPMRMSSVEASEKFEPRSVDLVLLDGGHDYDSVRADIAAWLPKVKPNGTIAGDDWNWSGVKRAATEAFGDRIEVLGEGKGRHWRVRL